MTSPVARVAQSSTETAIDNAEYLRGAITDDGLELLEHYYEIYDCGWHMEDMESYENKSSVKWTYNLYGRGSGRKSKVNGCHNQVKKSIL